MVSESQIEALRAAAATRDWNEWGAALDRALMEVEPAAMVAVAEEVLRRGLATFERNAPGATWPRRALDGETTVLSPEYASPGGNSFAAGVQDWLDARAAVSEPDTCRRLVVSAIGEAVMAELCALWGAKNPDEWRRWYEWLYAEEGDMSGWDAMRGWQLDPEVQAAELALWNDVADRLAALP
jgi:hypothetical protein